MMSRKSANRCSTAETSIRAPVIPTSPGDYATSLLSTLGHFAPHRHRELRRASLHGVECPV
jgi:hypothetical protein